MKTPYFRRDMTVKLGKNGKYVARLQLATSERDSKGSIVRREKTKSFKSKTAAEAWEQQILEEHQNTGRSNIMSSPELAEYKEAKDLVNGEDLRTVVRFWSKHHPTGDILTVREVWERYESSTTWEDYKPSTQSNKKHGIEKFCEEFGDRTISEVTVEEVEDYLEKLPNSSTRNTNASTIRTMFSWAAGRKQKYLQTNQLKLIDHAKVSFKQPEILTVEQVGDLFNKAKEMMPNMIPFLALQFFAGIRTNEVAHLEARDFDLDAKTIYIRPEVAKTKGKGKEAESARLIEELPGTLWKWLGAVNFTGEVDAVGYKERLIKIYKEAGVLHPNNVGRHSFCSYAYALEQNAGKVRKWTGHSNNDTIFKRHYAALVKKAQGELYFKILPDNPIKVSKKQNYRGATKDLSDEDLIKVSEIMNYTQIAKAYGVSVTAISKRLKKLKPTS